MYLAAVILYFWQVRNFTYLAVLVGLSLSTEIGFILRRLRLVGIRCYIFRLYLLQLPLLTYLHIVWFIVPKPQKPLEKRCNPDADHDLQTWGNNQREIEREREIRNFTFCPSRHRLNLCPNIPTKSDETKCTKFKRGWVKPSGKLGDTRYKALKEICLGYACN